MNPTAIAYDDRFLDHDTGPGHAERPDRLRSIVSHLRLVDLWELLPKLQLRRATEEELRTVHTARHVEFVRTAFSRGVTMLDQGDTHVSESSYDVALLAAGAGLSAVDAVVSGDSRNAFCIVRPPGHHAESNTPMGFCLFNNVAVAARYAQQHYRMEKVAIVDWDVHHGNGTQEIFYSDPTVLYISTHQYPLYPGTGARAEKGEGRGAGFTLNIPMHPGSGEQDYLSAFRKEIIPALDAFKPELLIISAGFDAHRDDPLANIELTEDSFRKLTEMMMESADKNCAGRIVSMLEGGYNLEALAGSVEAHLRTLSR